MTRLRVCESCERHVFVSEASCPFCGAVLGAPQLRAVTVVNKGLSRAQRLAVAAAVVGQTAGAGCFDGSDSGEPRDAGGNNAGQGGAGQGGEGGTGGGEGGISGFGMAVYGAPLPQDAGHDTGPNFDDAGADAGDVDASQRDAGEDIAFPVYGLPPPLPKD